MAVFNCIERLEFDDDLKSLSAGINVIEKKLHDAAVLFEFAKRAIDSTTRKAKSPVAWAF
ncbi:hypothetical protein JQ506_07420 [Shinella sp. PSBB067]|uniref:hypothetical protein n=1 Tax=Shinella sp. PSBB067 TaxID=2715959 RepID=UPI00193C67FC|nr:hypothetical protein [Shinella sp. PSBB067]QRI64813.1 hypothetical protein JQ506_07420 [Shinella sp. PSBB067]